MITSHDRQEAIAYYNGKIDPNPNDAVVLAACQYLEDRDRILQMLEALKTDIARAGVQSYTAEPPETYQRYSGADTAVHEPTLALDGDTEFERAIMAIPVDWEHMERLIHVFAVHMENLAFANKRAYNAILDQIEAIARS